jgi:hypothetical protein
MFPQLTLLVWNKTFRKKTFKSNSPDELASLFTRNDWSIRLFLNSVPIFKTEKITLISQTNHNWNFWLSNRTLHYQLCIFLLLKPVYLTLCFCNIFFFHPFWSNRNQITWSNRLCNWKSRVLLNWISNKLYS